LFFIDDSCGNLHWKGNETELLSTALGDMNQVFSMYHDIKQENSSHHFPLYEGGLGPRTETELGP